MELICTIGPKVKGKDDIETYIKCGMTMPRFNFSHVYYERFDSLLKSCTNMKNIMGDLRGNKIRISNKFKGETKVAHGSKIAFCLEKDYEELFYSNIHHLIVPISYEGSFKDFEKVSCFYMKDATMKFKVKRIFPKFISAITTNGGILRAEKGINAPGLDRSNLSLTSKDKYDIDWGIQRGINIFVLSFVISKDNVLELRNYINESRRKNGIKEKIKVYSKIECQEGYENFEEILKVSDGIILGRGDLKGEMKIEEIPIVQESLVKRMKKSRKNFFIATYLLDSMTRFREPSPGEIIDIYEMCKNKVNGVILCTELTVAKRPEKIIFAMNKFIKEFNF
ncbi:pyruvate kinase [Clostridium sp. DSM 8431]|uniref:pyruvate kinase n=1 Tax=Clostridium sp. DSM 8431 TaxID=1761781 RepID=UPI0008ECF7D5|nr:pyruvate kinase [Clostridium sp. DSM 8431]SFU42214.1 pyruvate kinase [Clostridium sp. DSM 8431]